MKWLISILESLSGFQIRFVKYIDSSIPILQTWTRLDPDEVSEKATRYYDIEQ